MVGLLQSYMNWIYVVLTDIISYVKKNIGFEVMVCLVLITCDHHMFMLDSHLPV